MPLLVLKLDLSDMNTSTAGSCGSPMIGDDVRAVSYLNSGFMIAARSAILQFPNLRLFSCNPAFDLLNPVHGCISSGGDNRAFVTQQQEKLPGYFHVRIYVESISGHCLNWLDE